MTSVKMNGTTNSSNTPVLQRDNGNLAFIDDTFEHNPDNRENHCSDSSGVSSDEEDSLSGDMINNRPHSENSSDAMSWKNIWKNITIEPMMFAHMFAMSTTSVVLQNLYIQRICTITLGKSDDICDNLGNHTDIEQEIDGIASKFVTYRSVIEAGFPILISLFLGPWTEIHGTKWPMLLPLFGYFLSAMSYLILCHIPTAPPELLLISSAPIALVGGLVSIIMSAFSFMSKKTNLEDRSFRVAMLEASWFLGGPLGILSGGLVYKYGNFTAVFTTSATVFLCAFIYGCIVIREELPELENREDRNCFADMFNVKAVKDMFCTVFAKRSGLRRRWLLLMLATISLRIFAMFGYLQNMYLYTRRRFQWDLKHYTEYSVSDSFIAISGGYVMIMTCLKIFKLPDAIIGILSTVGIVISQFVFAFAISGWMMYLGASLQMFSGLISIILRSMISKIVAKEEIARVFTFLACGEASMPLIGVPLFSYIFSHTLTTFPGAMFMVSAAAYTVVLISFIYLYFSMRNSNDHEEIENRTEEASA